MQNPTELCAKHTAEFGMFFDQPPGKPALVICANCLLFALCSVGKMKEGCSVAFLFWESFTFCFSPLILLPWKSGTSARLLLPLQGKHIWARSTRELAESLARSKRGGGKEKEKEKDLNHYLKHFIKSKAFLLFIHQKLGWRCDIRDLPLLKVQPRQWFQPLPCSGGNCPFSKSCRRNRELATLVLAETANVLYFYLSQGCRRYISLSSPIFTFKYSYSHLPVKGVTKGALQMPYPSPQQPHRQNPMILKQRRRQKLVQGQGLKASTLLPWAVSDSPCILQS